MLLKTDSWQYSFCTFEFTQKIQLGQKCWDNMIFSCFWMGNWIFWNIKRLQTEKKKKSRFCSDIFAFSQEAEDQGITLLKTAWRIRIWPCRSELWHEHFLITEDTGTNLLWIKQCGWAVEHCPKEKMCPHMGPSCPHPKLHVKEAQVLPHLWSCPALPVRELELSVN